MPPVRICGVTRVSSVCHVFTLGTSMTCCLARAKDASRRNELVSTPSYLTTWLLPPNLSSSLNRDVSWPSSALLRWAPEGPCPGSPKNEALMVLFDVSCHVPFVEYERKRLVRSCAPRARSGKANAPFG